MLIKKQSYNNLLYKLIIIMAVVSVFLFVILCFFNKPYLDDYAYSLETREIVQSGNWNIFDLIKAAIRTDIKFYYTWQGLYSSAFILSLQPGIFADGKYYGCGAIVLMGLLFFSICFLLISIRNALSDKKVISNGTLIGTGFVLFAMIIQGMPGIVQGIYWFNGAWNYTFFFCLLMMNCGLMIKYWYVRSSIRILVCISLISFVISGGNHVTAFQNIIILNLCMIAQYVYKKRLDMIIPTSVAIVGFVIVMLAPGTRVRQGEEMSQSVLSTLVHTVLWCYKYLCSWINIQYLCMLILLIPVAIFVSSRIFINKTRLIHPLWILLVELLVICGMLCVPYKAMGNFGQDRLLNTIWMTFMLFSAFLWVYYLIWSNLLDSLKDIVFSKYGRLFLFVAGVVLFFYSNSNFMDYLELFLKGEAADYYTARF